MEHWITPHPRPEQLNAWRGLRDSADNIPITFAHTGGLTNSTNITKLDFSHKTRTQITNIKTFSSPKQGSNPQIFKPLNGSSRSFWARL